MHTSNTEQKKPKKPLKKGEAIKGAWYMYCRATDIGIGAPYDRELFLKRPNKTHPTGEKK